MLRQHDLDNNLKFLSSTYADMRYLAVQDGIIIGNCDTAAKAAALVSRFKKGKVKSVVVNYFFVDTEEEGDTNDEN